MVVADDFGTGEVFLSFLWFFMFFIWIWLLIMVFGDLFRSHDLSRLGQGGMGDRHHHLPVPRRVGVPDRPWRQDARARGADARRRRTPRSGSTCSRRPGTSGGGSVADELARLADLKDKGVIDDAEFQQLKAKALAST